MTPTSLFARLGRLARKPPAYVIERIVHESERRLDRWLAPRRVHKLAGRRFVAFARAENTDELWMRLSDGPYPAVVAPLASDVVDAIEPGESARVFAAAESALERRVDLLGSGPVDLGKPIDWSLDHKTGLGWPRDFAPAIDYVNRDRPSDVKVAWEISRLQWLMPAGQAYLLTGDERYAAGVRDVLDEWMTANPLAYGVNWACTMEAALRIFTWTWFFHVFARSHAWADESFRLRFLACLYLHGDFTRRHIEKSDVNGNHYTADLAAMVFAGLFFGDIGEAPRWSAEGWSALRAELGRQVHPDGVDYEASSAYHRLVLELFLWPALYRLARGQDVELNYAERLKSMARFVASYSRTDGSSPLWGDADDGRVLPFGSQPLGDHRYLIGMVGQAFADEELVRRFGGDRSELVWARGPAVASSLAIQPALASHSQAFPDGGCYVMRDGATHVFIDCGPLGLAGRGGHGHNDALSFEAWLEGAPLVTDCGAYVYTASFEARNRFRSTASHNTPQVDGLEINRFDPENLWMLQDDARAAVVEWRSSATEDTFKGGHRGYERIGVTVERAIRFDKMARRLDIIDRMDGSGVHAVEVPLHLSPEVSVVATDSDRVFLHSRGRGFAVAFTGGNGWGMRIEACQVSPRYGIAEGSCRIVWTARAALPLELRVSLSPRQDAGTPAP
jgi:uncharacterized heparinase superfamily protein